MKLRTLLGAAMLMLALASCSSLSGIYDKVNGTTVSQQKAAVVVQSAMTLQRATNKYLALPVCVPPETQLKDACRDKAASKKVAAVLKTLIADKNALWANIVAAQKAGTGVGVVKAAYDALTADTSALQSIL